MYDNASSKICQKFTVLKINTSTLTVFIIIRQRSVLFCQPTWQFNCLYSNQEFDFPIACRKSRHSCFKQCIPLYGPFKKKCPYFCADGFEWSQWTLYNSNFWILDWDVRYNTHIKIRYWYIAILSYIYQITKGQRFNNG
jgi:hypothetical protein